MYATTVKVNIIVMKIKDDKSLISLTSVTFPV